VAREELSRLSRTLIAIEDSTAVSLRDVKKVTCLSYRLRKCSPVYAASYLAGLWKEGALLLERTHTDDDSDEADLQAVATNLHKAVMDLPPTLNYGHRQVVRAIRVLGDLFCRLKNPTLAVKVGKDFIAKIEEAAPEGYVLANGILPHSLQLLL